MAIDPGNSSFQIELTLGGAAVVAIVSAAIYFFTRRRDPNVTRDRETKSRPDDKV
jgi:hypothetical protein